MIIARTRLAALAGIAVLVAATSLVSFAESYRGLFLWAGRHGLHGLWAAAWPLQVDTFIAVGELALFVALADRWALRSRLAAWMVALAGLALSVAGNVGHVAGHDAAGRVTAAVPPLAAAAALAVGLGVLKHVVAMHAASEPVPVLALNGHAVPDGGREAVEAFRADLARGEVPGIRRIKRELRCGQDRAAEVRRYLFAIVPGTAEPALVSAPAGIS